MNSLFYLFAVPLTAFFGTMMLAWVVSHLRLLPRDEESTDLHIAVSANEVQAAPPEQE